ncbi:PTS mannose transporter subunit IIAB [Photobacterium profundum]|uniref:PTS system, fructose-specific, IIC component n=1 Tax=Photobacterium profundum 3TCK TaxID=314280 RepID=Q1ZB43_9GAMM|nr:PTS fructose transporter subunit IIC [Photobacterium profundum]EAS45299.1 PTS system, fructose-specific, IIC component [Photobacterium profundum 3TCK]PSV63506.1 PTS mannose transporter subunit IIAB [Photobacterium profundum]
MATFKSNKSIGLDLKNAIMTGVSYMLPFIIAGAVLMGIARIGASMYGIENIWDASHSESANNLIRIFHDFDGFGGLALSLMLPIVAGYIAFAIANRPGLAPGMIGGILAGSLGTGFLGALVAGLIAGYIVKFLAEKVKLPRALASAGPIFILPVGGTLLTCIIMMYIIGDPLSMMNKGLEAWLLSMSGTNKVLLAAVIGGMVGFDLGGPVNKAAVTTAMALLASGIYDPNTAAQVAIIIPPIGLGLATLIWKHRFPASLQEAGKASTLMGLIGVSEGAIPFALANPKIILINVLGSATGAAMAVGLGAVNKAPISGFYGWLAVENWFIYIISIAVGSLIITLGSLLFFKVDENNDDKKKEMVKTESKTFSVTR